MGSAPVPGVAIGALQMQQCLGKITQNGMGNPRLETPRPVTRTADMVRVASSLIDVESLYRLNRDITAIHSPTGRERAASEYMVRHLAGIGLEATYQAMGEKSGNAIGRIRGSGGGPSLLLYAPIDTHLDVQTDRLPLRNNSNARASFDFDLSPELLSSPVCFLITSAMSLNDI